MNWDYTVWSEIKEIFKYLKKLTTEQSKILFDLKVNIDRLKFLECLAVFA